MRRKAWLSVVLACVLVVVMAAAAGAGIVVNPERDSFRYHANIGAGQGNIVSVHGATISVVGANGVVVSATIPAGACVDHGSFCTYRNSAARAAHNGVANFHMEYRYGKMWMLSYGGFVNPPSTTMTILLTVPDVIPDPNGGPPYPATYSVTMDWRHTKSGWIPDWSTAR